MNELWFVAALYHGTLYHDVLSAEHLADDWIKQHASLGESVQLYKAKGEQCHYEAEAEA